jgi:putative thioredoxin
MGSRSFGTMARMDVTTNTFEREVIEASKTLPVVVDFWAPWCGPCLSLGPTLDRVAESFGGRVKLVKINSDDNPELSQAFNIRSIPNVIAFKGGRAVAQFMGAIPEPQVRQFFGQLVPSDGEETLRAAEAAYTAGKIDEAAELLAKVPADVAIADRVAALEQGIAFARAGNDGPSEAELRASLGIDPLDHDSRIKLASVLAGQRRFREAMEELLEVVRLGHRDQSDQARVQLLQLFTLASPDAVLVAEYRRKLANALH